MQKSQAVSMQIERPYSEVYEFLAEPRNFPSWGPVASAEMVHLRDNDWLVELSGGPMVMRFTERNPFGVLDYRLFPEGAATGPLTSVRLVPNGDGCEFVVVWLQREGVPDAQFISEIEWLKTDIGVLKALLET